MTHQQVQQFTHMAQIAVIAAGSLSFVGVCVWSAWAVHMFNRDKRRMREGLCMHCGYDLSHSKVRCPECGHPILKLK